jgi:hypothetical protein
VLRCFEQCEPLRTLANAANALPSTKARTGRGKVTLKSNALERFSHFNLLDDPWRPFVNFECEFDKLPWSCNPIVTQQLIYLVKAIHFTADDLGQAVNLAWGLQNDSDFEFRPSDLKPVISPRILCSRPWKFTAVGRRVCDNGPTTAS